MKLGKNPDGTVQVPPLADHNETGWYRYGPAPGQPGSAVILGHVDSATGISVFYRLKDLRRGDRVYVALADAKVAAFAVDGVQKAARDAFPTAAVYSKGGYPGLRLITCGGPSTRPPGHYLDNIVAHDGRAGDNAVRHPKPEPITGAGGNNDTDGNGLPVTSSAWQSGEDYLRKRLRLRMHLARLPRAVRSASGCRGAAGLFRPDGCFPGWRPGAHLGRWAL